MYASHTLSPCSYQNWFALVARFLPILCERLFGALVLTGDSPCLIATIHSHCLILVARNAQPLFNSPHPQPFLTSKLYKILLLTHRRHHRRARAAHRHRPVHRQHIATHKAEEHTPALCPRKMQQLEGLPVQGEPPFSPSSPAPLTSPAPPALPQVRLHRPQLSICAQMPCHAGPRAPHRHAVCPRELWHSRRTAHPVQREPLLSRCSAASLTPLVLPELLPALLHRPLAPIRAHMPLCSRAMPQVRQPAQAVQREPLLSRCPAVSLTPLAPPELLPALLRHPRPPIRAPMPLCSRAMPQDRLPAQSVQREPLLSRCPAASLTPLAPPALLPALLRHPPPPIRAHMSQREPGLLCHCVGLFT